MNFAIVISIGMHTVYVGTDCGTASAIFAKMEETLQKHHIPWEHCVGVSTDSTSVNLGIQNSIMTRVKEKTLLFTLWGAPATLSITVH